MIATAQTVARDRPTGSQRLTDENAARASVSLRPTKTKAGHVAALVEFRDVCKTYDGETLAVDHLDLSVAPGEFVTFLGPSGSGKTTSLMMLAGFEPPTNGENSDCRAVNEQGRSAQTQYRNGVPELRAVSAHDGGREHSVSALRAPRSESRMRATHAPRSRPRPAQQIHRPATGRTLRWPAAACRVGARAGFRPAYLF